MRNCAAERSPGMKQKIHLSHCRRWSPVDTRYGKEIKMESAQLSAFSRRPEEALSSQSEEEILGDPH